MRTADLMYCLQCECLVLVVVFCAPFNTKNYPDNVLIRMLLHPSIPSSRKHDKKGLPEDESKEVTLQQLQSQRNLEEKHGLSQERRDN